MARSLMVLTLFLSVISQPLRAQTVLYPYCNWFDQNSNLWTADPVWQWGTPNGSTINVAASVPNAWKTNISPGNPNAIDASLYTPIFDLSNMGLNDTASLYFQHWHNMQTGDFAHVQYSINGSQTWVVLGFIGGPQGTNWYNANMGGYHGWNLSNPGWQPASHILDPAVFNGQDSVQFRFRFHGIPGTTSDGWAIDNVCVAPLMHPDHVGIEYIFTPSINQNPGTLVNPSVLIVNKGFNTQTSIPIHINLNGLPLFTETWTGILQALDSASYLFTSSFAVPTGPYVICAETQLPAPAYNDSTCNFIGGLPSPNGTVYGLISWPLGLNGNYKVYLIEHNIAAGTLSAVDSTFSLSNASVTGYAFTNVAPGNYLVKAAMLPASPNSSIIMPTYHTSGLMWNQATTVVVSANTITPAYITPIVGSNPGGPGFVGGLISQGANKGPGDPIEGVQVMLLDANAANAPLAYTYSDSIGKFSFSGIPLGTYKVYAEVLGKTTIAPLVTVNAANPSITGIQIVVGTTLVSAFSAGNEITKPLSFQVIPNPNTGQCSVELSITRSCSVQIEITDLAGKQVLTETLQAVDGQNIVHLDLTSLDAGLYILRIVSHDGHQQTGKLVKQ